ncbi:hypothetical protein ASE23_21390 [Rhizobium sp. Root73]|nr:hypothetical protein ASE23_21390 [Rhizobium sp. Root73]
MVPAGIIRERHDLVPWNFKKQRPHVTVYQATRAVTAARLTRHSASNDLYASAEPGTKQSFMCILIRIITTILDQAHIVVCVTGPGDA